MTENDQQNKVTNHTDILPIIKEMFRNVVLFGYQFFFDFLDTFFFKWQLFTNSVPG